MVAGGDEAAVPGDRRRAFGQRPGQALDQHLVVPEVAGRPGQLRRPRTPAGRQGIPWLLPLQQRPQGRRLGQGVAQGRQVARAAAPDGEPRQGPLDVRTAFQAGAQRVAQPLLVAQHLDAVEPRLDRRRIGQRRRQAVRQQARAGAGDAAVDGRQQAALAAAGQGLGQFEIAPRRRVDLHDGAGRQPP